MSNAVLKGNASGTGTVTLETPNTNSDRTISLPDAAGTMMVSGNMPTFDAYPTSNQSYSSGVTALVEFQATNWDTAGAFNTTGSTVTLNGLSVPAYAFCPNVAGYYQVNLVVRTNNTNQESQASIKKNGADWSNGSNINISIGTQAGSVVSSVVFLNGTGDYIQGFVYVGSAGTGSGNHTSTNFSAIMVRGA
jgi:hypothetical protein